MYVYTRDKPELRQSVMQPGERESLWEFVQALLVLIGATEEGSKELLAVVDGYREGAQSRRELLQQLKRLGLSTTPKLAIGDGSLGFWIVLQEEYGPVAQQRCWVHKTANILDKMPKRQVQQEEE